MTGCPWCLGCASCQICFKGFGLAGSMNRLRVAQQKKYEPGEYGSIVYAATGMECALKGGIHDLEVGSPSLVPRVYYRHPGAGRKLNYYAQPCASCQRGGGGAVAPRRRVQAHNLVHQRLHTSKERLEFQSGSPPGRPNTISTCLEGWDISPRVAECGIDGGREWPAPRHAAVETLSLHPRRENRQREILHNSDKD
ncbi:hypothetical protein DFP72DRAFT_857517, partial [Ephemerocybe angulata]